MDHVFPKRFGGGDGRWNRSPACERCDQAKSCRIDWRRMLSASYRYSWVMREAVEKQISRSCRRRLIKKYMQRVAQRPASAPLIPQKDRLAIAAMVRFGSPSW